MVRVLMILIALVAIERAAQACCLGCACTKYQDREVTVHEPAVAYTHSVRGGLPRWSVQRVVAFLVKGTWTAVVARDIPLPRGKARVAPESFPDDGGGRTITTHVRPLPIQFVTADKAAARAVPGKRTVLIRRIEKHGSAILVEVDSETWKLGACPRKAGFICLLPPGKLALAPIEPPGDAPAGGGTFAKPPSGP